MSETRKERWIPFRMKTDFLKEGRLDRFWQNASSDAYHHEKLVKISFLD